MVALGVPAIVGSTLKDFAAIHPGWALAVLVGYWAVLGVGRLAGGVVSEIATRWRPRLVESLDSVLAVRLSRFERTYRHWLIHHLKRIDLQGLATTPHTAPSFDQIYIDLSLVNRAQHQVSGNLVADLMPGAVTERLSIAAMLSTAEARVLAILGAPGSGKTTLLRQVARLSCRGRLGRRRIPILLYLREHAETIATDHTVRLADLAVPASLGRTPPPGWFDAALRRGRCVVLFDGLDEVGNPNHRHAVLEWIDCQIGYFGGNHFVLASRRHGYEPAAINSAEVLQVRQLTLEQISRFVENWYGAVESDRTQAQRQAHGLRDQLASHDALGDMAVNPLLLTMIVNVHRERGTLPDNRIQLYKEICEVLLWRRAGAKGLSLRVSAGDKQALLQALAYAMMIDRVRELDQAQAGAVIADLLSRLTLELDTRQMLTLLVHDGLLVEPEPGVLSFCHKTFQEYLASVEIHRRGEVSLLAAMVDDEWWRETVVLYTAQHDADEVIEACLQSSTAHSLGLAFDCTEQGTRMSPRLRQQMNTLLLDLPGIDQSLLRRVVSTRYVARTAHITGGHRSTLPVPAGLYRLFAADEQRDGIARPPGQRLPAEDETVVRGARFDDAHAFRVWINLWADGATYRLPYAVEAADLHQRGLLGDAGVSVWISKPQPIEELVMPRLWEPEVGAAQTNLVARQELTELLVRDVTSTIAYARTSRALRRTTARSTEIAAADLYAAAYMSHIDSDKLHRGRSGPAHLSRRGWQSVAELFPVLALEFANFLADPSWSEHPLPAFLSSRAHADTTAALIPALAPGGDLDAVRPLLDSVRQMRWPNLSWPAPRQLDGMISAINANDPHLWITPPRSRFHWPLARNRHRDVPVTISTHSVDELRDAVEQISLGLRAGHWSPLCRLSEAYAASLAHIFDDRRPLSSASATLLRLIAISLLSLSRIDLELRWLEVCSRIVAEELTALEIRQLTSRSDEVIVLVRE
ncbi:NACHT domain-containing NTPase [Nocardia sp. SYP-A9097]|uniref:NACHT domain-containing protein n=1 Tax=Nocardia sp. SYP-A9097 TaxID=2663237 RepID=UPI001E65D924|nr:NACHT domain-containing protein [Nocardia sp. SYP-A9097]